MNYKIIPFYRSTILIILFTVTIVSLFILKVDLFPNDHKSWKYIFLESTNTLVIYVTIYTRIQIYSNLKFCGNKWDNYISIVLILSKSKQKEVKIW